MKEVSGEFSVELVPQMDDPVPVGRVLIEKQYSGALIGCGKGQMLSKRTEDGAAGYVALEEFEGRLDGREGSFTLMHLGIMYGGESELNVQVVPGSGTGALAGIRGVLHIDIESGKHRYRFVYEG
ncbi:DUF3224 domain-containing protein [Simiduia sp. 21SJ11W-1]|uniref:DUF3224 domain-containing protein n=1 Tax=Simiduia sp. 21SJ11W-1 TaxID=2909669 RepID=UPI0020A128A5|nr:DUF3224 domain-containing protein [Simiduia sp. 21SJ11W-1]UTA48744.1 DUF3224 domain-containing protein [Simiduia sp. 21SJ11W-1]